MRRILGISALLGLPTMAPGFYLWLQMDVPAGQTMAKVGLTMFVVGLAGLVVTRRRP